MKAEIAYIGNQKLVDLNSVLDVQSTSNSKFREVLESFLRRKIVENGFFYSVVKVLENKDHKITNVLVDNCVNVKIKSIRLVNINLDSDLNLESMSREINYLYKSKSVNEFVLNEILDNIYNRAIKLCLLVKDIKIIVELNNNNKNEVDIICILDLISASTNYILDVKFNTEVFAKNTRDEIINIYDKFIFDTDNLSLYNLKDSLKRYINQHSYIKQIIVNFSEKDEQQILDIMVHISLLSSLSIKSMSFFDVDQYNNNIITSSLLIIDGNIANKIYFRLFSNPFNVYNGLYLRFKKQMGYKRLFYIGLNYYLKELNPMSDLNFILKIKQRVNNKITFISRLSFRYFFKLNNINIGLVLGHKTPNLDIRFLFLELYFIKLLRTGVNISWAINTGLLRKLNMFVGIITMSSLPYNYNVSNMFFRSAPALYIDTDLRNFLISMKFVIEDMCINDINKISCDTSVYYTFKHTSHVFQIGLSMLKDVYGIRYRPIVRMNLI